MLSLRTYVSSALFATSLLACATDETSLENENETADTSLNQTSDAVVLEWNQIAVNTIGATPPFPSTRAMAAVQLAVFEAANATTGKYTSYYNQFSQPGASAEAAAITAAHGVLKGLFPAAAANLDSARDASLAKLAPGTRKTRGISLGEAVAARVLSDRTNDGSAPPAFFNPTDTTPGAWQRTPSCPAGGGAFYHWKNVKPYGIASSSQFRAPAPPALTSAEYAEDYNEVLTLGSSTSTARTQQKADVARIYAAQPPHQGWNSTARQIAGRRKGEITETARTFALLNMSLSDGHISVFESKYHYNTWRPETAIPRGEEDGNDATGATTFTPFITTPCFPSYPSAHGVGAGAGAYILATSYGDYEASTNAHPSVPGVTLTYNRISDIVQDVSDARVYGGIHFRVDQDVAAVQGAVVANHIRSNFFQPIDD